MASLVEMFQMPLAEIEERFTRSEITLIAWRSQETYWQMRKKMKQARTKTRRPRAKVDDAVKDLIPKVWRSGEELEAAGEEIEVGETDDEEQPDMSKMTSKQALTFMNKSGLTFGIMPPKEKK